MRSSAEGMLALDQPKFGSPAPIGDDYVAEGTHPRTGPSSEPVTPGGCRTFVDKIGCLGGPPLRQRSRAVFWTGCSSTIWRMNSMVAAMADFRARVRYQSV